MIKKANKKILIIDNYMENKVDFFNNFRVNLPVILGDYYVLTMIEKVNLNTNILELCKVKTGFYLGILQMLIYDKS